MKLILTLIWPLKLAKSLRNQALLSFAQLRKKGVITVHK